MVPQTWIHLVEGSCVNILKTTTTKTQPVKFFIFMSSNKHGKKKKKIRNSPVEEAKKMKCCKRLIYKQFVQVSGLCSLQFLSYLPKRFTHLCRALYGDAILVDSFGPPIWPSEINKNVHREFTFVYKSSFFSIESYRLSGKKVVDTLV